MCMVENILNVGIIALKVGKGKVDVKYMQYNEWLNLNTLY